MFSTLYVARDEDVNKEGPWSPKTRIAQEFRRLIIKV